MIFRRGYVLTIFKKANVINIKENYRAKTILGNFIVHINFNYIWYNEIVQYHFRAMNYTIFYMYILLNRNNYVIDEIVDILANGDLRFVHDFVLVTCIKQKSEKRAEHMVCMVCY